ncbi:hypothetical protein CGMCC3_g2712 [Colletotrichum fructicola]|nr:uncharacterized protein CGMCC3_g2712 [Colletotrichum fructicola]KAE9581186.1 hypothetical protein CGMCC3_g2712 [Colletotrichum fructicola]
MEMSAQWLISLSSDTPQKKKRPFALGDLSANDMSDKHPSQDPSAVTPRLAARSQWRPPAGAPFGPGAAAVVALTIYPRRARSFPPTRCVGEGFSRYMPTSAFQGVPGMKDLGELTVLFL